MAVCCGTGCPCLRGLLGSIAVLFLAVATGSASGLDPLQPPGAAPAAPAPSDPTPPMPTAVPTQPATAPAAELPTPVPSIGSPGQPFPNPPAVPGPQRFTFNIDPKTPVKELLPTPPNPPKTGPVVSDDLAKIPEVDFQARPEKIDPKTDMRREAAFQLAKIKHLNDKKSDAFMTELLASRPELAGMPFAMGDKCRSDKERMDQFAAAVSLVRQAMGGNGLNTVFLSGIQTNAQITGPGFVTPQQLTPLFDGTSNILTARADFWSHLQSLCTQQDAAIPKNNRSLADLVIEARIAALMQMLAAESVELRLGLVKFLIATPHVEATKALARMAIFSPEDDIRRAAITGLRVRREKDYTDILVNGLRYPWPAVADRAADAIVRLERKDLIPELLTVLESDDPRLPAAREIDGKKVSFVREMVRMNHHRNCVMCHAPSSGGSEMTAEVAVQGQALPSLPQGYNQSSSPDLLVRIDVTYLRQDFSAKLPVPDAAPWPEEQRFDFFVRERKLTDEEVVSYRDQLISKEEGVLSPYHKAAVSALRQLTGKDTAPTAEAWRKLLKMPKAGRVD